MGRSDQSRSREGNQRSAAFVSNQAFGNSRCYLSHPRSTFILYSALWEFYDPDTGKTIGSAECAEITGQIQVQAGIPFINLDLLDTPGHEDESFRTSDACD